MNKSNLIKEVSKKSNLSQKDCLSALNAITEIITNALKKGDNVTLIGFGKFEVKHRAQRKSINPQTRQPLIIPAARVPVFRVSKTLKQAIK